MEENNFRSIYEQLEREKPELIERFKKIKLIALDFDGTFTNNLVVHHDNGTEAIIRSKTDSMAIDLLKWAGVYDKENYQKTDHEIDVIILSKETNKVVQSVAQKTKIKCTQSIEKKPKALDEERDKRNFDFSQVLFMGNDLNDMECMKKAGIGVAVADAMEVVRKKADYVTKHRGGKGAFREIVELIILSRKIHPIN
ncbi:MAG: HAD hydrolase family protein [Patescibacteria group bacterium]